MNGIILNKEDMFAPTEIQLHTLVFNFLSPPSAGEGIRQYEDRKKFILLRINNMLSSNIVDITTEEIDSCEDFPDGATKINFVRVSDITLEEPTIFLRADNPIRALCYIEGYIGRIMAEHGLAIEPELQKRFDMVYVALDRSDVININVPQFDIETFAQEWNQK